jgi:hypothetical protein
MATTFCKSQAKVALQDQGSQNIINSTGTQSGLNTPSANGSRIVPKDAYKFVAGSTAVFHAIFTDTDKPVQVDTGTKPTAVIYQNGVAIEAIEGELAQGQLYEYEFKWNIPQGINIRTQFIVVYRGELGGVEYVWGQEYFVVTIAPQNIKLKQPGYATVDEVRQTYFGIDTFFPDSLKQDKQARDALIQQQIVTSSKELNGQLNLRDFHSVYNDNFNLYVRYHTVWSIMMSGMGADSSTASSALLDRYEKRWRDVLKQIKMHSQLSNIPTGRA